MAKNTDGTQRPGLWSRLWQRPKSRWLLGIPIAGFLMFGIGAIALGSVNWVAHKTSSNDFCVGCHSHQLFVRPEYEASGHFKNEVGVRADCADCHLPHDNWFEYMVTKAAQGSKDVVGELSGKISTREKFEAHRGEMAQNVWEGMLRNDSKFCHSCHSFNTMKIEDQGKMPARMHTKAMSSGQSCVECHRGIVHALPHNADELWEEALTKVKKSS